MWLETIRLSKGERDQLSRIKRHTGIAHYNEICRWALCVSLAEPSVPPRTEVHSDSLEIAWKTFAGPHSDIFAALIAHRCHVDGLGTDDETLATYFRLHLQRGIGYLAGDPSLRSIEALISRALPAA